ncbi:MAG TPA: SDR family oxidoreductase [Candidatus Limnocylindrales bacterium]|nr:SDR family oxidoreductase [Candidatus Limnocylindrales bacterium]
MAVAASHRFAVPAQFDRTGPRSPRNVLITGAAAGLPKGIALAFARAGERVSITYRPGGTPPDAALALLRPHDTGAFAVAADLVRFEAAADALRAVEAARGPVDVLVHGVGPFLMRRFARCTPDDYRRMVDGNLASAVATAFAVLPGMRERGYGRLVFFGMEGSSATRPFRSLSLYGAAKAGLVMFARTLALEEARHGITVNVVEPGDFRDKEADRAAARALAAKNPMKHAGSWEDVAAAVLFATAEENGFLNGMVLGVNGGAAEFA